MRYVAVATIFIDFIYFLYCFFLTGIIEEIFSSQWRRLGGRYECSVPVDGDLVLSGDGSSMEKGMCSSCILCIIVLLDVLFFTITCFV